MPYNILKGEMAKRSITIEMIADFLQIHRNSVSNKINKTSSFSIEEARAIQEEFFPMKELKHLFATDREEG